MIRTVAALSTALLLSGAALAGTELSFPAFTGISAHSGASVILRHGAVQRVTIIKGDLKKADLHVSGNTLDISPCKNWCWHIEHFEVEIVSPKIDDITAHSGGDVRATGDFPRQPSLHVTAHSGGDVDTLAIPADAVDATAHSGGDVHVKVLSSLKANAHSGGDVVYSGTPAHVEVQSHSGGSISQK